MLIDYTEFQGARLATDRTEQVEFGRFSTFSFGFHVLLSQSRRGFRENNAAGGKLSVRLRTHMQEISLSLRKCIEAERQLVVRQQYDQFVH